MDRVGELSVGPELETSGLVSTHAATHDDGSAVSVRLFAAGIEPEDATRNRFDQDAASAAALSHPSIASPVHWSGTDPIYVTTRPLGGASLTKVTEAAGGSVSAEIAAGLTLEVAGGLELAHRSSVVHAGIGPGSVIVDMDGAAVLTDFALARLINTLSSGYSQVMRGSIASLAPEQMTAPDKVGPGTDVFGLGVLLYRATTGKEPFAAPSPLGMSIRLSMGNADPIDQHGARVPKAMAALIMRMIAAKPEKRPSMGEVISELSAIVPKDGAWRDEVRRLVTAAGGQPAPEGRTTLPQPAPRPSAPTAPASTGPVPWAGTPPPGTVRAGPPPAASGPPPVAASAGPRPVAATPPPSALAGPPAVAASAAPPPAAIAGPPLASPRTGPPLVSGFGAAPVGPPPGARPPPAGPPPALGPAPWQAGPTPAAAPPKVAAPPLVTSARPEDDWDLSGLTDSIDGADDLEGEPTRAGAMPVDDDDDVRPTIRRDSPLVSDDEIPAFLRDTQASDDEFGPPTAITWAPEGEDDPAPFAVPKTVVMTDPRLAQPLPPPPSAPAPKASPMAPPAARTPPPPLEAPPPAVDRAPRDLSWLLWVGVGLGAFILLAITVILTVYLAS